MEITIQKNDAFRMLDSITRNTVIDLCGHIVSRLKSERLISGDPEDCGLSIHNIAENNGMTVKTIVDVLFPTVKHRDEIPELMKVVFLFGSDAERPCPDCGCELELEPDGEWLDVKCSNTECEFRDCTEPDHDNRPGGYSFDN